MHAIWIKFIICAAIIFFAGKNLAKYADVIAEKTGFSRLWVGMILVAMATSLPELFTGVGSVVFVNAPNIAVGNILGANSYNLLNVGFLDLIYKEGSILASLSTGQLLTAGLSLIPLLLLTLAVILRGIGFTFFSIWNIGIFSILIFISYIVIIRGVFKFEKKTKKEKAPENKYENITLKKAFLSYALAGAFIIASGIWLAYIGKELSETLRLTESFTGSIFMGFVTTLPEITVSIAALLIGAREIAIANMLGSNLFNLSIIFIDDILYRKAAILAKASEGNAWMGLVVMAMTAVIIIAMAKKFKKKIFNINWYVPVLFVVFVLGMYINFKMSVK